MLNNKNIAHLVYRGRRHFFDGKYNDVAIKVIQDTEKNHEQIGILRNLEHDNIVKVLDVGTFSKFGKWIYIVMPECSMTLEEYITENQVSPEKAFSFFKQMVDGVAYLHKSNIAHHNLKPDNILVSKCESFIRISDFATSTEVSNNPTTDPSTASDESAAVMDEFKSPEILGRMLSSNADVLLRSDIFSLGLVAAYLFSSGKHPFGNNPVDRIYKIKNTRTLELKTIIPESAVPRNKRQSLIDLVEKMLQHEATERPTAQAVQQNKFFSA